MAKILADLLTSTPECAALWAPQGRVLREGELLRNPELGEALLRLGSEGVEPFYRGEVAAAVCDWVWARGGSLSAGTWPATARSSASPCGCPIAIARFSPTRRPRRAARCSRTRWRCWIAARSRRRCEGVVAAMAAAQSERTPEFLEGLDEEGFLERFLAARLGSTTHISVLDADGRACSCTCTNGEGSGVVVPGTGMHLNNVMGEEDLNPFGFHLHPAGRRMPSMMAPSVVMRGEEVELVLGSAGSNRIRSALLQTIVGVVDHGLPAREAVDAPRVHFENGVLYAEPGIDLEELGREELQVVRFGALNLFFGGVQAVQRRAGGDRRRRRSASWRRGGEGVSASGGVGGVPALRGPRVRAVRRRRRVTLLGCGGGITAPDLFIVQRSGQRSGRAPDAARQRRRRRALQRRRRR